MLGVNITIYFVYLFPLSNLLSTVMHVMCPNGNSVFDFDSSSSARFAKAHHWVTMKIIFTFLEMWTRTRVAQTAHKH
jgi:hypothetical protein